MVATGATVVLHADPTTAQVMGADVSNLLNAGLTVITIGGSLLALYGRITATTRITLGSAPPAVPLKGA